MDARFTIGEFSKVSYLSVKALRHYHDVGLLEPEHVDPVTGYRRYASDQVATAQAIRRFRDLDMPIAEVRQVLQAPDIAERNRSILVHLERMQGQLEQTQTTVASLQALLTGEPHPLGRIEIRHIAATTVVVSRGAVRLDDCGDWLEPALVDLHAVADAAGLTVTDADGALYPDELFENGAGEVTAFVPVAGRCDEGVELPAVTVAVLVFDGPFADVDQAYAALGTVVAERGIGGAGPIREHYLTPTTTEVCWPVTAGATAGG